MLSLLRSISAGMLLFLSSLWPGQGFLAHLWSSGIKLSDSGCAGDIITVLLTDAEGQS